MYDMKDLFNRYQHDSDFYTLVGCLENFISQHGVDPVELRQATFFACYKYRMEHVDPLTVVDGKLTFTESDK